MKITIEDPTLILLIGTSSSGKSTFCQQHFLPTEVVSSDHYRAVVCDDENSTEHEVSRDAFALVHTIVDKRLKRQLTTVVDATNVTQASRQPLLNIANQQKTPCIAIVFHLSESEALNRLRERKDRNFSDTVIHKQYQRLLHTLTKIEVEGYDQIHTFHTVEEINAVEMNRKKVFDLPKVVGDKFDIIGDVHGCYQELMLLLQKLSYKIEKLEEERDAPPYFGYKVTHPEGRKAFFVGDLTDRGDNSPEVLRIIMSMCIDGVAYSVRGNHDDKLFRSLQGRQVKLTGGLDTTLDQLSDASESFLYYCRNFLNTLRSHYVLMDGQLVIAHAGLKEELHGIYNNKSFHFALYGPTNGKQVDEYGFPLRIDWAKDYEGEATVVYGHTPQKEAIWRNNTINIDTGCAFGGALTALRYPEKEIVSVKALKEYAASRRPFLD